MEENEKISQNNTENNENESDNGSELNQEISLNPIKKEQENKYGIRLNLEDDDHIKIIKKIDTAISEYKAKFQQKGFETDFNMADRLYSGDSELTDFPFENAPDFCVPIARMMVDVMGDEEETIVNVNPMMSMRPVPSGTDIDMDIISKKEKCMEYIMSEVVKIKDVEKTILFNRRKYGTGIAKIYHYRDIQDVTDLEIYEPTDIVKFVEDFSDDRGTDVYKEKLKNLEEGKTISVWVDKKNVNLYFAPKVENVDPRNFYIDQDIKELKNQRVIAEEIKDKTWEELKVMENSGYFDKGLLDNIVADKGLDWANEQKHNLIESNILLELKNYKLVKDDEKGEGEYKRCIITYIKGTKYVLRAIMFPFITRVPNYVVIPFAPRNDAVYGDGICHILKDISPMLDMCWNQSLVSAIMTNAPVFVAEEGSKFDPTVTKYGPASIYWVGKGSAAAVKQLNIGTISNQMMEFISRLERYAEWVIGVTALMTGRESPLDPTSPASKSMMLLQQSNKRVMDYTKQIHKANKEIWWQCDRMFWQYYNKEKIDYMDTEMDTESGLQIYKNISLTKKEWNIQAEYVPTMTDVTVNKALLYEQDMSFGNYLLPFLQVNQNLNGIKKLYEILIRNKGGQWEKYVDIFIPKGIPQTVQPNANDNSGNPNPQGGMPGFNLPRDMVALNQ